MLDDLNRVALAIEIDTFLSGDRSVRRGEQLELSIQTRLPEE